MPGFSKNHYVCIVKTSEILPDRDKPHMVMETWRKHLILWKWPQLLANKYKVWWFCLIFFFSSAIWTKSDCLFLPMGTRHYEVNKQIDFIEKNEKIVILFVCFFPISSLPSLFCLLPLFFFLILHFVFPLLLPSLFLFHLLLVPSPSLVPLQSPLPPSSPPSPLSSSDNTYRLTM